MPYLSFPKSLSEQEDRLLKKFSKLTKLRDQLKELQKVCKAKKEEAKREKERKVQEKTQNVKEDVKKLIQSGKIRIKSQRDTEKVSRRYRRPHVEKVNVEEGSSGTMPSVAPFFSQETTGEASKAMFDNFVKHTSVSKNFGDGYRGNNSAQQGRRGNTVYVEIPSFTTEETLKRVFETVGAIYSITYEKNKSQAFITFETVENADKAIAEMNGHMIEPGIPLKVVFARHQKYVDPAVQIDEKEATCAWSAIASVNERRLSSQKDPRGLLEYDDPF